MKSGHVQEVILPAQPLERNGVDVLVEDEGQADGETHDGESLGADGERQNLDGVGDQQGGIGDIVEGVVEELRTRPGSVSCDAGRRDRRERDSQS